MSREFLVGCFRKEQALLEAVQRVRARGFKIYDVYAPYPVHGLDAAMGLRRSRLPVAALLGGLLGLATAVALQVYTNVYDWPLNVGGKPNNSTLAFVPISFELTVLGAGLTIVAAFFLRCRLFPGARALRFQEGTTDDIFAVVLRRRDTTFDAKEAWRLLEESGAHAVRYVRQQFDASPEGTVDRKRGGASPRRADDASPEGTVDRERGGASPRRADDASPEGTVDRERGGASPRRADDAS